MPAARDDCPDGSPHPAEEFLASHGDASTDIEGEVRDAVVALLSDWVGPGEDARELFLASVANGFTGHGTAPGEYFRTRDDLRALTEREHAEMPYPFTLRVPWVNVRLLRESLALADGELAVEVEMNGETFVEAPRFSLVLERADADRGWRLLHFHMSVPDAMQDEGATMGDLLTTRNRELEREVARRTDELSEQADVLRTLNETNAVLAAELDLNRLVQRLVDAGREIVGAEIGAFFYEVEMRGGQAHARYALSGAPREAFAHYPLPRMTDIFRPTFAGEGMLRIGDVLTDPRYGGHGGTEGGMPPDHPPVRSFLSAPVKDRHGTVIGGLIFGHAAPHRFTAEHEALLAGVASQAAIAIANARLYEAARTEIEERRRAEAALAEARDRAEAANRAKSAFLAGMSHELRTPLNGILGYAQLLGRDGALADEHRAGLRVIERSGRHLLGLINDVLDLAKIEAGKLEVRPAPFRLPDLLRSVAALARIDAETQGLDFEADLAPELPAAVHADERRLRQVLLNLLSNAVKFTARGAVTLRARVEEPADAESDNTPDDEPTVTLHLEVTDTGVGIAPEQVERVFQPFEQVADAGRHTEGTGLGLAISRRLVGMMGGTLGLDSTPGVGSTFTVRLPVRVLAADGEAHPSARRITGVVGQPTALVVDDKAVNRSLLTGLLVPLGFHVVEAENGREAIAKAEAVRPDVVLMDLVMPVVDGFEATRRLRRTPGLERVPIVALSASVFRVTQQESLAIGCDAFLPKPVDLDALLDTLGTLLDLEWVSADDLLAEAPAAPPTADAGPEPTRDEAAALYDLALRGDVQALLAALDASPLGDAPFGARLHRLAARFQMAAVRDALAPYLDPPPDHA